MNVLRASKESNVDKQHLLSEPPFAPVFTFSTDFLSLPFLVSFFIIAAMTMSVDDSPTSATDDVVVDAPASSEEEAESALRDNISKKGKNAYYYAHAHKATGPKVRPAMSFLAIIRSEEVRLALPWMCIFSSFPSWICQIITDFANVLPRRRHHT